MKWVAGLAIVFLIFWIGRFARAAKQRYFTKRLLRLLRQAGAARPAYFDRHRESVSSAERAVAESAPGLALAFTPTSCLKSSLDAARATMIAIEFVFDQLSPADRRVLNDTLDAEHRMLARRRLAFQNEPGSYACRHLSSYYKPAGVELPQLIVQISFHTQGSRAFSRSWCRHCLVGFEDQWPIAVSGGH